ncbi:protein-tyrosine phosphatase family protein [Halomicrobium salinisoli]|uniref:protein-tyrosine phosphatase family protein n=1 Tax=Halomicrobium salinisoli TaxID=2878391 RepID=UPI001CF09564|nr:phosphatase [Halomicrobium salinisoli]
MPGPDWRRHGSAVVRPFGHCHDGPIARRIGDRDLFVGNRHAADPERCDRSFESVLSLTREPRGRERSERPRQERAGAERSEATREQAPATTHHRPLIDGPGNDWAAFEAAADVACGLVDGEHTVLIHCSHGISRSPIVAATAIAVTEDRPLADALSVVRSARPPAVPHPELREQAVCYVAARR